MDLQVLLHEWVRSVEEDIPAGLSAGTVVLLVDILNGYDENWILALVLLGSCWAGELYLNK